MSLGWAGRVRQRTPQEERWKGSREGREWCVRRRWGDGKGQRRDAVRQKDGWKERRQRRPTAEETHHLWMTLQARCLSQQCTAPLTLCNAHSEHGVKCSEPGPLNETQILLCKLIPLLYDWGACCVCSLHKTELHYLHFGARPSGQQFHWLSIKIWNPAVHSPHPTGSNNPPHYLG